MAASASGAYVPPGIQVMSSRSLHLEHQAMSEPFSYLNARSVSILCPPAWHRTAGSMPACSTAASSSGMRRGGAGGVADTPPGNICPDC